MKKIGVVGIVIQGDREISVEIQKTLTQFGDIIVGRMGVPRNGVNAIALIVEGSVERISALSGKLGKYQNVSVKSALTAAEVE